MKLLEQLKRAIRARHLRPRTEEANLGWVKRYVRFHNTKHPNAMGEKEITNFLTHLAVDERVSPSTQNQAKSALLFLYKEVLNTPVDSLRDLPRARAIKRLPVVLTREEVGKVLSQMNGVPLLVATLLSGSGMRLQETLSLRIKDVETDTTSGPPRNSSATPASGPRRSTPTS